MRNVSGGNSLGGDITLGGTTRINTDAGSLLLTGNVSGNGQNLTLGGAGLTTLSGNISTIGALAKEGSGRAILTGTNSYDGATTVSAGVLELRSGSALGSTVGGTTVASGGVLDLANNIVVGKEALTINGQGLSTATTGALRNTSGNNTFGGDITLGSNSRINSDAGTLTLTGNVAGAGNRLNLGGEGAMNISGSIGNVSALIMNVADGVILSGSNTYDGSTLVEVGTVKVRNSGALGSTAAGTQVDRGGTLELEKQYHRRPRGIDPLRNGRHRRRRAAQREWQQHVWRRHHTSQKF